MVVALPCGLRHQAALLAEHAGGRGEQVPRSAGRGPCQGKRSLEQETNFKNLISGQTVDKSRKQKAGDVLGHKSPGVGPSGSPGGTGAASVFGGSRRRVESEEEKSYGGRKGDDPPANSEPAKKRPQKSQQGSR